MDWFTRLVGTVLVLLSISDIYLTVLFLRGDQRNLLSVPLSRGLWWFFKTIVRYLPPGRKLYAFMGPTLLVAIVATWIILMLTGFALIYWPALGPESKWKPEQRPPILLQPFTTAGFPYLP
ncbi:hypothetical protein [Egbenema bharatensis]|uniref:hypothetical protein n=1 Tax=Egbenema bharatensis TaxID=3463334 RepID=UPI003A8760DB